MVKNSKPWILGNIDSNTADSRAHSDKEKKKKVVVVSKRTYSTIPSIRIRFIRVNKRIWPVDSDSDLSLHTIHNSFEFSCLYERLDRSLEDKVFVSGFLQPGYICSFQKTVLSLSLSLCVCCVYVCLQGKKEKRKENSPGRFERASSFLRACMDENWLHSGVFWAGADMYSVILQKKKHDPPVLSFKQLCLC